MNWLNYHHLYYFWLVAKEGSVVAACERLHLAQPTVSTQIKQLEKSLATQLFERSGRRLTLTEIGRTVFRYADEIFTLGEELVSTVRDNEYRPRSRLMVGVTDVLSKLMTVRILGPVLTDESDIKVTCIEGKPPDLLAQLAVHELDVVFSDAPIPPHVNIRAYNHLLGECGVTVFAKTDLARRYRKGFPASLDGAPMLLPTPTTMLRRSLDRWFEEQGIAPRLVGEFEDAALIKAFGQAGRGLFVVPSTIELEVQRQYQVRVVGRTDDVKEQFFAISVERRVSHPAIRLISQTARTAFENG